MSDDLLEGLNPVQYEAVTHTTGPLLIVAGAGSGKTRVLTHRIAHLIKDQGVSPFEILAITFTNKAADEMKSRVGRAGRPGGREDVGVHVPLGVRAHPAARRRPPRASRRRSRSTTRPTPIASPATCIRDLGLDAKKFPPRSVHAHASRRPRTTRLDPEEYKERAKTIFERKIADVYGEYQARLLKAGAMDFDDLLVQHRRAVPPLPEVLEHYQRRFRHVMVDEYQDTNRVQNELVLHAQRPEHGDVCVVGDPDQCLPPGTLVRTPDGEVPIEQVRVGDEVLGTAGGTELGPAAVPRGDAGALPGDRGPGPRRRTDLDRNDRTHGAGPFDPHPWHLGRLPHVPGRSRLADRSDQERQGVRAHRQARARVPHEGEPGASRCSVDPQRLRLEG